jgi:hypothetical protein
MLRLLLLSLLPLLLGSCFFGEHRLNSPIDAKALSGLEIGRSSAADVTAALGAPEQVVELGFGSAWLYRHDHEKSAGIFLILIGLYGGDVQSDRVWAFFNENGLLTQLGASLDSDQASYILPGLD